MNDSTNHDQDSLKKQILDLTAEYYERFHRPVHEQPFEAGRSRVNYAGRLYDQSELTNLVDSSLEFWLTYGRYSREFEHKLADLLSVERCLLVNSGSSANLLAFMALTSPLLEERQLKPKDEVITIAAGFPTTIAPIIQYGAVPVFVDVEFATANIDVSQLEDAISGKTKAVFLAHTLGNPFNIHAVKSFCNKHGLWLIEDNCDALGSMYDNKYTGTWGDIGTSSFYPPHHMTMGEGGAVYSNDPLLIKIMLSMRDWGRDCWCDSGRDNSCGKRFQGQFGTLPFGYDHKYVYSHFGYNLKCTDMQAAIGCAQLNKLLFFKQRRQENFQVIYDNLEKLSHFLVLPQALPESDVSWFGFLIGLEAGLPFDRNDLVRHLEGNNIQTRNLFAGNMVRQPCFASLVKGKDYRVIGGLPNTDKIMNNSFWIGVFPGMTREKLDFMTETITNFIKLNV